VRGCSGSQYNLEKKVPLEREVRKREKRHKKGKKSTGASSSYPD